MGDEHLPLLHELNNLLAVILSYSELLAQALPDSDPARDDLGEIDRAARRAGEIVARLSRP